MTRSAPALVVAALLALGPLAPAHAADELKLATSRLLAYVTVPLMIDEGFLAAEGLTPKLATFDSAQPITVAVVSGDVDFGVGGLSAAFYNLAGQGQLRIIAGGGREMPGYHNFALLASNRAEAAGLKSFRDLAGHSVAVTQLGTVLEYSLGRVVEKDGLDFKTIRVQALQSNSNVISALTGGQLDAALLPGAPAAPSIDRGDLKRLAWIGDEMPGIQNNVAFVSTRVANERPDLVARFLRAYRKAARFYHDAVADQNEKRADGPDLPKVLKSLAAFAHLSEAEARASLPWLDGEARLDTDDIEHQIDWFRGQGMIKGTVSADAIVDHRYAMELPKTQQVR